MDGTRSLLRHTVATVAYRSGKALRGAPEQFAHYRVTAASRTPLEIVAHMGDLFEWGLSIAQGMQQWRFTEPTNWAHDVSRYFASLAEFDAYLGSERMLAVSVGQLFQGPVADALTHVGQLTLLRRAAESPVRSENYFAADITIGRVGVSQPPPRHEFD